MRSFLRGALFGAIVVAFVPRLADAIQGLLRPVAKAGMKGGRWLTVSVMAGASDAADTVKDTWAETVAENHASRHQAAIIVSVEPMPHAASRQG